MLIINRLQRFYSKCRHRNATKRYLKTFHAGGIVNQLYGYIPAILKEYSAGWRIEYYVRNPLTSDFSRRQEKVQHYVN